jgi:hypothetical protein
MPQHTTQHFVSEVMPQNRLTTTKIIHNQSLFIRNNKNIPRNAAAYETQKKKQDIFLWEPKGIETDCGILKK